MANSYKHYYVKGNLKMKILTEPATNTSEEGEVSLSSDLLNLSTADYSSESSEDSFFVPEEPAPNPGPSEPQVGKFCIGEFYVGLRLEHLLYSDKGFRNSLGLYLQEDLTASDNKVSKKFFRSYNQCASLEFVKSVYATFVAVDSAAVYETWGATHRTYIVCGGSLSTDQLSGILYNTTFKIGSGAKKYKIQPDSLKPRRSRKSSVML